MIGERLERRTHLKFKLNLKLGILSKIIFNCLDKNITPTKQKNVQIAANPYQMIHIADTVILTEAKLYVRQIEFEGTHNTDENNDGDVEGESIEAGPFVVALNLAGTVTQVGLADIPAGTYHDVQFEIHKPDADESVSDPDFKTGTADSQRFSIVVGEHIMTRRLFLNARWRWNNIWHFFLLSW